MYTHRVAKSLRKGSARAIAVADLKSLSKDNMSAFYLAYKCNCPNCRLAYNVGILKSTPENIISSLNKGGFKMARKAIDILLSTDIMQAHS